jgi:signal transduction histidine kinase
VTVARTPELRPRRPARADDRIERRLLMDARLLGERWVQGRIRGPLPQRSWISSGRYAAGVVVLTACYYAAAQLGFTLHFTGPIAAIVWLPVGVGIVGLYLGGLHLWPAVLIGDLLADQHVSLPLGVLAAQTAGNVLEIVVGVVLLRHLVTRRGNEDTLQGVAGTAVALATAAAISATIGVAASNAGGVVPTHDVLPAWRTWWFGDFAGALVLVPPVVGLRRLGAPRWQTREVWEGALVLATVAASSVLAWQEPAPLTYVVFPALIWSALRLHVPGASVAAALASAFAVWGTVHHLGAFGHHSLTHGVLQTQLFITVATFSTLCLAGITTERRRLAEGLSASRLRLIHAAEAEQRRLAHNLHDGAQQRLAALMVHLSIEADRLKNDPRHADAILRGAHDEIGHVLEELRALAHGSYPPLLADRGLAAVIAEMADRSPVPVEVEAMPDSRLPESAEASAYYVIAEALANALKHARAGRIRIGVHLVGSSVVVEVGDDGAGGAIEAPDSGLQGLRDRVEAVGGMFDVQSQPGHGTRIAATIPILPTAWTR